MISLKDLEEKADKATPGPWSYDADENEIHSDTRQDSGGDPAHICEMISPKINSNSSFIASANPETIKILASCLRVAMDALEYFAYGEEQNKDLTASQEATQALATIRERVEL